MNHQTFSVAAVFAMICFLLQIPPTYGYIRDLCFNPLGEARIDPLMTPGKLSSHVHHLHGSGNLGIDSTDADYLLEANCTSCSITVDKSGYWAPAMYFQYDDGTFELLNTSSAITIYYKLEKRVNFENKNYTVFPKGFRMITGDTFKRTWTGPWPVPAQSLWGPADTTQQALTEKSIGFNCMNYDAKPEASFEYGWIRSRDFTDKTCTAGLRAEILFPSCWDGVNLDSADHKSHVAYPTLLQDGACPETHPVYLPVLFYETIWDTQAFVGVPGQYVLANGDPTGFGYHADFLAAWEDGILQAIMDDPICTDHDLNHRQSTGLQEKCPVIASHIQSPEAAAKCQLELPDILRHEEVRGPLAELPGSVPVSGVRHDPGTFEDDKSAANAVSSGLAPIPTSPFKPMSTHAGPTVYPGTVQVPNTTPAPMAPPTATILSTSIYTTDGTYVKLIIEEEVVTTTVEASDVGHLAARHGHKHGVHV